MKVGIEAISRVQVHIGTQVIDENGKQRTLPKDTYILVYEEALQD